LAKLQQLTYLALAHTKITDAGLVEVAKLQNLKVLELWDNHNRITDTGLRVHLQ